MQIVEPFIFSSFGMFLEQVFGGILTIGLIQQKYLISFLPSFFIVLFFPIFNQVDIEVILYQTVCEREGR